MLKSILCAIVLLVILNLTASGSSFSLEDSVLYYVDSVLGERGMPYSACLYNCLMFTGNDVGPLNWFDVSGNDNVIYVDSIGQYEDSALYHKHAINEFMVNNSIKRYLFQGVLNDLGSGSLIVYDITDLSAVDTVCSATYTSTDHFWTQDVFVYDTTICCSTHGYGDNGGLYVYDFSPANQSLTYNTIVSENTVVYNSLRNNSYLYMLRKQQLTPNLVLDMYSVSDYSLVCSDTSLTISKLPGKDQNSFTVIADYFIMNGVTVFDTLAFAVYPENDFTTILWILDPDPGVTDPTYKIDTIYQDTALYAKDTKYADHYLIFLDGTYLRSLNVSDADNVIVDDSIRLGQSSYDFVVRPNTSGNQDILLGRRTLLENDYNGTFLYRFEFDTNNDPYLAGDFNGDERLNVSDIISLIHYTVTDSEYPVEPLFRGDTNGDGYVNYNDVLYLYRYIFLSGPQPRSDCDG